MPKVKVGTIKKVGPGLKDYLKEFYDNPFYSDEIDVASNDQLVANWKQMENWKLINQKDDKNFKKQVVSWLSNQDPGKLDQQEAKSTLALLRKLNQFKANEADTNKLLSSPNKTAMGALIEGVNEGNLSKERFKVLIDNSAKLNEPDKAGAVAKYINIMSNSGVRLTSNSKRLEGLLGKPAREIPGVNQILKAYAKMPGDITEKSGLNADIYKTVLAKSGKLAEPGVAAAVNTSLTHLTSNGRQVRAKLLGQLVEINPKQVSTLLTALDKMRLGGISTDRINGVLTHASQLNDDKMIPLISCLKSMNDKVPFADRHNNIGTLMKMNKEELTQTSALLGAMDKITQQRFDAVMKSIPLLTPDQTTAMASCVKEMEKQGIPVSDNLDKLSKMKPDAIQGLARVMNQVGDKNISKDRFNILMDNAHLLTSDKSKDRSKDISNYIKIMSQTGIPISDDKKRLEKMIKSDPEKIQAINSVLNAVCQLNQGGGAFNKTALTSNKYDQVIDHAGKLESDDLKSVITTLGTTLSKSRFDVTNETLGKIMQSNPRETADLLGTLGKKGAVSNERIQTVLDNAKDLKAENMPALKECVGMLEKRGVPMTKNDTLKTLMSMDKEELSSLKGLLNTLNSRWADDDAYKAIARQLPKLCSEDGLANLTKAVNAVAEEGKPLVIGTLDKLRGKEHPIEQAIKAAIDLQPINSKRQANAGANAQIVAQTNAVVAAENLIHDMDELKVEEEHQVLSEEAELELEEFTSELDTEFTALAVEQNKLEAEKSVKQSLSPGLQEDYNKIEKNAEFPLEQPGASQEKAFEALVKSDKVPDGSMSFDDNSLEDTIKKQGL